MSEEFGPKSCAIYTRKSTTNRLDGVVKRMADDR